MHIRVGRSDLYSALANLQNVTSKRGTIAIISNVLMETMGNSIRITGTDLETGIQLQIQSEVLSEGKLTIPCKKLFEIIRESSSSQIDLEEQQNFWIKIQDDVSYFNLAGMSAAEFPEFPEYDDQNLVEVSSGIIGDLIDKTIYCVANEGESQFNLAGALLEKEETGNILRMVSSDGHRLAVMQREVDADLTPLAMAKTILIPKKGLNEWRKLCDQHERISFAIDEKQVVVKGDNQVMVIRLLTGEFPKYRAIMKNIRDDSFISIDRLRLINAMKRMNLFSEDRFHIVNFNISHHSMVLSSQSADIGNATDELAIKFDGDPLNIFFNGKYFIDCLAVLHGEKVKLYISSEQSPCFIMSDDDSGFVGVVMPMKL
ncbi:MAG: DNA polymerase III subunit beta [Thermodesulfobacteriota bacterium]